MRVLALKMVCLASDYGVVLFSYILASYLVIGEEWQIYSHERFLLLLSLALLTVIVLYVFDVYPQYKNFLSFFGMMLLWDAMVYVFLLQGMAIYLAGAMETIGRGIFAVSLILQVFLLTGSKWMISQLAVAHGPKERAIIVGYNPWKEFYFDFLKEAKNNRQLPFDIVGIVSDEAKGEFMQQLPFKVLGEYDQIEEIVKKNHINTLILTSSYAEKESLQEFLIMSHHNHNRLISLDGLYEETTKKVPYSLVNKTELLNECLLANKFAQLKKKRVFDITISLLLLVLLFPVGCLIALGIKMTSSGSVFYRQERVGFRGNVFKMIKFRTMRMNAEEKTGAVFAEKNDPRITAFGRFLRRTHLDEIPQLINVLKEDMSFVGPRPEREEFIRKLEKRIPIYALRLFTKPGITGWAQVNHGYAASVGDLEEKFCYDLYYLKHMTISLDIKILLLTVAHLFFAKGR